MRLQPVLTHPGVSRTAPPPYFNPHGPTPGALQGDDYPIEFDADGDPIMPACLDRKSKPELKLKEAA